jgi:hypothetical protein
VSRPEYADDRRHAYPRHRTPSRESECAPAAEGVAHVRLDDIATIERNLTHDLNSGAALHERPLTESKVLILDAAAITFHFLAA